MVMAGFFGIVLGSCAAHQPDATSKKTILVTYSILGSIVRDLVGDHFTVVVSLPNGLDPHEWSPSAKDMEALNHASLIVQNGLHLEGGMQRSLGRAQSGGVPLFTASDYIPVRTVKAGQGLPTDDPDQQTGAEDPHLWMSPENMKAIELALAAELDKRFGVDLSARAQDLAARLDALNTEVKDEMAAIPAQNRVLVTGHESMGYFADAYGLTLVGAIIPSLTDQAEVSAADLARLKQQIQAHPVPVIFSEIGTPPKVAHALASELKLKVVPLTTHALLPDSSYFTFLRTVASAVAGALK